jgi:threonine/homoserine/homoserine lactone efflux protein
MADQLGPLIAFAVAMSFTPGPNVIMVTAAAATFGFRQVIPIIVGISAGFGAMVLTVALGLGEMVQAEPRIHALIRYGGAAYLLYLAWRIASATQPTEKTSRGAPISFREAAFLQLLNPKGWASALGGVGFYMTGGDDALGEALFIATVLLLAVSASVTVWAAFGVVIGRFLSTPTVRRGFNWTMAGLLVASIIPVLW